MIKTLLTIRCFNVGLLWTAQNGCGARGICNTPEKQEVQQPVQAAQLKYRDLIRRLR
jgi:hypothetical protein